MSKNTHIKEFLIYYCNLTTTPEYAVLITGSWGSGKTWFVQDAFKNFKDNGIETLYVSLYGVSTIEDIESEFFRQLHPILAHKGVKLLGKLTKGLLKTAINFDLDYDGKSDGNVSFGFPSEKLIESVKIAENKILIFDDIERCSIPICDLLGYINQFVEHQGFKSILIANEKEIIEREEKDTSIITNYRRIKEKLIGRTFEVHPELEPALQKFTKELQSEIGKKAITDNEETVFQIYENSKYKNLRILRHSLCDFDRLLSSIDTKYLDKEELVTNLLALFLVYSFEIKSGNISPCEVRKIENSYYSNLFNKQNEPNKDNKFSELKAKYVGIDLYDSLFESKVWEQIFSLGMIPKDEIEQALENSKYLASEKQPNWVRLWHGIDLDDCEFVKILSEVDTEWKNFSYEEIGIIKHVAGLLFRYSSISLYKEDINHILDHAKQHVDKLKLKGKLQAYPINSTFSEREAWGGLGFFSKDEPIFKDLCDYVANKQNEAMIESYPNEAKDLLELMKNDFNLFYKNLILTNQSENRFYNIPILSYVSENQFIDIFFELEAEHRRQVAYIFEERYEMSQSTYKLITELDWLKNIRDLLMKEIKNRVGKMSGYTTENIVIPSLNNAIDVLEKLKSLNSEQTSSSE